MDPKQRSGDTLRVNDEKEVTDHLETVCEGETPKPTTIAAGQDDSETDGTYYRSVRFIGSVTALILTANCTFISYTIPVNLLTVINADIGPSANINLVTLVHTLIKGVMLLIIGRITDIFGRRWFLIGGQILCGLGSVICALAPNVNILIGGTVVLALGGAVQPLYPLYFQEIVPQKYRGLGQAVATVSIFPFLAFGPAIGRSLVVNTALRWRWAYWMNTIFCAVSAALFLLCYFPPSFHHLNSRGSKLRELAKLDYIGLVLYVGGAISLLLGFVWSTDTTVGGWDKPRVIAPLAVGGCALIAFALWELYGFAEVPILPWNLLKIKGFVASAIVGIVGQMSFYSFNLFVPRMAMNLFTSDNLEIGLISSCIGAGLAVGEILFGAAWKRIRRTEQQMRVATACLTLFCGLMALANPDRMGFTIACILIASMFVGWVELLSMLEIGLVTPAADIGIGQGFFGSCRNIGGTIATSIFVSIFGNRIASTLKANVPPAVTGAGLPSASLPALFQAISVGTPAAIQSVPGMNSTIAAALDTATKTSYTQSFRTVYLSSLAFSGVAMIASFFTVNVDSKMTDFVNKRVDRTGKEDTESCELSARGQGGENSN